MVKSVSHTGKARYLGFLNDREQALVYAELRRLKWQGFVLDGGFESAERKMLCVFEDDGEAAFPFQCVQIKGALDGYNLTHRDYLGALLALGLERSCIGDIRVDSTGAAAVVQDKIVPLLREHLTQVGRVPVVVFEADSGLEGDACEETEEKSASVSSLRLDAVLAAMLSTSRKQAASFIAAGRVQVNHLCVETLHYELQPGDLLSVQGAGRYRLLDMPGRSRKNRIWIQYLQYK